ncbi:MAG: C4-type zinc ribbon domain-containing protein [Acidimicrobiales bacterium]
MSRWDALLSVQEHDTNLDQLAHRLAHLPTERDLAEVMGTLVRLEATTAEVQGRRHDLGRDQQRLEDEIATLSVKASQHDKALYSGAVTNPRELQAMQDEIAALRRRILQLEDQELELMEQIEPLDADPTRASATHAELDERAASLRGQIAEEQVAIESEQQRVSEERAALATTVESDLLAEYDTLRPQSGGIAIARLVGGSCGGCHLSLSAVEVDRIKKLPPEAPAHCEECGRLLAR